AGALSSLRSAPPRRCARCKRRHSRACRWWGSSIRARRARPRRSSPPDLKATTRRARRSVAVSRGHAPTNARAISSNGIALVAATESPARGAVPAGRLRRGLSRCGKPLLPTRARKLGLVILRRKQGEGARPLRAGLVDASQSREDVAEPADAAAAIRP